MNPLLREIIIQRSMIMGFCGGIGANILHREKVKIVPFTKDNNFKSRVIYTGIGFTFGYFYVITIPIFSMYSLYKILI